MVCGTPSLKWSPAGAGRARWAVVFAFSLPLACGGATPGAQSPSPAAAEPASAASPPLPFDPRVRTGTLDNGLTYQLQRHQPEEQRAHLLLSVKTGSLYEEDDQRGLAHFVEHMAFNGTERFGQRELLDFFEKSGLKFGSHANARTSYDRTEYQLSVPTDRPELLTTALDVMLDWAGAVKFAPDELAKERPVLLSEWTAGKGASQRLGEQYRKLLFGDSRYSERDVIGDPKVLEHGPRQRLVDFYQRWYRPDRMAVIVVGDIDEAALEAAITERFSALKNPDAEVVLPDASLPIQSKPSAAVMTDSEATALLASVVLKASGAPAQTEADYRKQLVLSMATTMLNRRLDALREDPKAPFTGAWSRLTPSAFGRLQVLDVSARAKEGQLGASLQSVLVQLEGVKRHGFVEAELQRTSRDISRVLEQRVDSKETINGRAIASVLGQAFVTGGRVLSPEQERDLGARMLAEIGVEEVNRRSVELLEASERLLLVSGPAREALPAEADLLAALGAAEAAEIEPYREEALSQPLMAQRPEPGKVVSESQLNELEVIEWTLSNGARVVVKPTDFEDDQILLRAISPGGTSLASDAQFASARFAMSIVGNSGVGELHRQALMKALSGRVASLSPWFGESDEGLSGSAAPKDAETLFQLTHLYATAPRRDEAAFEAFRAAVREGVRNRDLNPRERFSDAIAKALWGDSPRRRAPTLDSVEALDLDTALAFYRERFSDFSDFTFLLVGKLDPAEMKPLVERYLASLPGSGRKEAAKDLNLHWPKGVTRVTVHAGKEDKAIVSLVYHREIPWSDNAHTDLVSLQSYLQIRLREVLREQIGATYSPGVSQVFQHVPFSQARLSISLQCKPADVEPLLEATRAVITEVKKSGVDDSYLEKLRSLRTRDLEEQYRSNGFWIGQLATRYNLGLNPLDVLTYHELTKRITRENLRDAARTYLPDDQYLDARLLPDD